MPDTLDQTLASDASRPPDATCELRFDVPLAAGRGNDRARLFERAWRAELAAQKKTALATPPARAVSARFRVVGPDAPDLCRYLRTRLAALPGGPVVTGDSVTAEAGAEASYSLRPEWAGVQIWLAFPAADLPALLRAPKNAKTNPKPNANRQTRFRGHRP